MSTALYYFAGLPEHLQPFAGQPSADAPFAPAIRSGVERGDPFAYIDRRPMSPDVFSGECDSPPHLAALTAGAGEPVANDPEHVTAEPQIESVHPDRDNAQMVEHERQNRLRRWHEPR